MALHNWWRKSPQSIKLTHTRISRRIVRPFTTHFPNIPSSLLKRASAITYDINESTIIVADKTGDVYSFPWPLSPPSLSKYDKIKSLPPVDDKNPLTKASDERYMGTFLLGHSSSVVACTLATAPWGRVLITVDRDEHVRMSIFPQTWIIHAMGLGHTAFVSSVVGVDDGVVTGGGDNRIILWDFNGVLRREHTVSYGSCVRLIRRYKDMIIVVGEQFVPHRQ
jgi:tRNA (guanine-N(7)-)-methyltransferase subunit TRM82